MRLTTTPARVRARLAELPAGAGRSRPDVGLRVGVPRVIGARIDAARLPWSTETVWTVGLGGVVALAAVSSLVVSVAVAAVLATTAVVAGWFGLDLLVGRADRRAAAALPDAVESVASVLRAGGSLRQAFAESVVYANDSIRPHLVPIAERIDKGVALADAFDDWAARDPLPGVVLAAAALALAAEVGGAAAASLDGVAATLRERMALDREVRALASQARASAAVMAIAPLAFVALATAVDPTTEAFLFSTGVGVACLAAGLALDLAGAWWMHWLTRGSP